MIPSLNRNSCFFPVRSSSIVILSPAFRNASSRSRPESVSKLYSVTSKIVVSGLKVTFVPRRWVSPTIVTLPAGFPHS